MDAIVEAAMRKWPSVPDCLGWLALDARGDWYMRDDVVQARGPFPAHKGSRIEHAGLREFIGRNYHVDAAGRWFFQNGPQRVFVQLEAAPWVLGVGLRDGGLHVQAHTGLISVEIRRASLDEQGRVFIETEHGLGLVRSLDMYQVAQAIDLGLLEVDECAHGELIRRAGVVLDPVALAGTLGPR